MSSIRTKYAAVISKIKPPQNIVTNMKGDTGAIIKTIMEAESRSVGDTAAAAPLLRGKNDMQTAKNVWAFVSTQIRYKKDPSGHEIVKSPSQTIKDGYADCKSMSLLAGSLLRNLDIEHYYRYTGYAGDHDYTHVYLVAIIDDTEVPIDTTYYQFGKEVRYAFKCDLSPGKKVCPRPRISAAPVAATTQPNSRHAILFVIVALLIAKFI